jgi:hypothetical protein
MTGASILLDLHIPKASAEAQLAEAYAAITRQLRLVVDGILCLLLVLLKGNCQFFRLGLGRAIRIFFSAK